jgi:hypothetical protein
MISEGFFRRHMQALGGNRDVVLLDVAQEYALEHLRRQGLFDQTLVFKGGTALRKYIFGQSGRFSVDLDFGLRSDDPAEAELALDFLEDATLYGVHIRLERRQGVNAALRIETPLGPVVEPARISIRVQKPWLPPTERDPQPFEYLDRGLDGEFRRSRLPVLDPREITAEKIAAFWRRHFARDLYDLEHLGRVTQTERVDRDVAELAALKIYFDVVDERLSKPPEALGAIFACAPADVKGAEDLGRFQASVTDASTLLGRCARRYAALAELRGDIGQIAAVCSPRDRHRALELRNQLIARLATR